MVLWDKIIERGENAILSYKNMNSEYYYFDDGSGLKYVFELPEPVLMEKSDFYTGCEKTIEL